MVRIIQPGGFSRTNLVRVGLIPHVEEVVVISSPESMTQDELNRIQQAAIDLGSKATFTLHTMPVVGVPVSQMLADMSQIKSRLSNKETWISTTGSTNKFVACLFETFPDHPTITMNRSDDSYYLSDGTTRPLTKLPGELSWQLLGLRHKEVDGNHHLFHGDKLIASPGVAYMNGDKLVLKWDMPAKDQPNKEQTKVVKHISAQIGRLCRLNSEGVYDITIPQSKFHTRDRFPIGTRRPVRLKDDSPLIHKNEMFSVFPEAGFPFGTQQKNTTCLHIAVNAGDITPTACAILAHKPSHVVLWKLNSGNVNQQTELNGKTAYLVSYLSGHLLETLDIMFPDEKGKKRIVPSEFDIFANNPIPQIDSKFHLIDLSKLSDTRIELPAELLNADRTLFDHNSGFPGLHHKILTILKRNNLDVERWMTDVNPIRSYQISKPNKIIKPPQLNLSVFLLRKFLPESGVIILDKEKIMANIPDILEVIIDNARVKKSSIGKPVQRWRINTGKFESKRGEGIIIHSQDDQVFNISNKKGDSLVIGRSGKSNAGNWLEDLAGYIIHHYWESEHSIIGLKANPILGNFKLGSTREVDNYAVTKFGVVVGEAKAVSVHSFESEKEEITGQLMGVVSLFGHRRGQIPLVIIDHPSDGYDDFSIENGVVVCSWWELQYPDRILHRFRHGTRTGEDKANIQKRREIGAKLTPTSKENTKEGQKSTKSGGRGKKKRKKVKPVFKGFVQKNQISFVEGTERACVISGLDVLEGKTIAIAGTKRKILAQGIEKNQNCSGFEIEILDEIPDSLKKREDFFKPASVYMLKCHPIDQENRQKKATLVEHTGNKIEEADSNQITMETNTPQQQEQNTPEMNSNLEDTLFRGKISIDKVERYSDSEGHCIIRGKEELEDKIIAIAKNKFKIFFDPAKKRENWWGYQITVKSTIPEDRMSKDIQADGYLENCTIIGLSEDE
jgi:hypothetical protein